METDVLSKLSKEQLEELVRTYARNMLALDGVWFQSVERELGMDRAMRHDERVWQAFTQTEARRIKGFLAVARQAGTGRTGAGAFAPLRGIRQPAGRTDTGKRFPDIPCGRLPGTVCTQAKRDAVASVSVRRNPRIRIFRQTIDDRIVCEPVSCFPRVSDPGCACSWRFTMGNPGNGQEEAPDDNGQGKV